MAKIDWIILCERAIVELQANTISLVALLENVTMPAPTPEMSRDGKQIGVPFRFYVVQQWIRTKAKIGERIPARLILKGPNKKQLITAEFNVDLTSAPKARVITQSLGFPLAGAGPYKCVVEAKQGSSWRTLREAEFNVVFLPSIGSTPKAPTRH